MDPDLIHALAPAAVRWLLAGLITLSAGAAVYLLLRHLERLVAPTLQAARQDPLAEQTWQVLAEARRITEQAAREA